MNNKQTIESVIAKYTIANNKRHSLYCKRSKAAKGKGTWTEKDAFKLLEARVAKIKASKQMRNFLTKFGLTVMWGDMNQVIDVQLKSVQDRRAKDMRATMKRVRNERAVEGLLLTLDKVDLDV